MLSLFCGIFGGLRQARIQYHGMLDLSVDLRSFTAADCARSQTHHLRETLEAAKLEVASLEEKASAQTDGEQNKLGQDSKDTGGHQYS